MGVQNDAALQSVIDNSSLNGAQKLKEVFRVSLHGEQQAAMLRMIPYLLDNPRFLALHMQEIFYLTAPDYIAPILEEGMRDGSIPVERPRAMAEAILVLCDMWINPLLRPASPEEVRERCAAFAAIMCALGLDIFDEEMTRACVEFAAWRSQSAPVNRFRGAFQNADKARKRKTVRTKQETGSDFCFLILRSCSFLWQFDDVINIPEPLLKRFSLKLIQTDGRFN